MQSKILNAMRVDVYNVQCYDIRTDEMVISRRMATIRGAEAMNGLIMPSTKALIDSNLVGLEGWTAIDFDPTNQE